MKKKKILLFAIIGTPIVIGLLYIFGIIYSFRNFGNGGNWRPIEEYEFDESKFLIEQKIKNFVSASQSSIWFSDSSSPFSKDGWYTVFVKTKADTVRYIFRFEGDSSSWAKEVNTKILLFSIKDRHNDITPSTIDDTRSEQVQRELMVFDSALIEHVKKEQ